MGKINVTYILSNINKAVAFEWIAKDLRDNEISISFILLNPSKSAFQSFLDEQNIPYLFVPFRGSKDLIRAFKKVYGILQASRPDAVHCHMFHATMVGLLSARILGIKQRIYTRHHSTYNWDYNRKGIWLDKLMNWLSTDIVAISKNVKEVLNQRERVHAVKISLIHHGFDLAEFSQAKEQEIKLLRQKYNPDLRHPVVGIIARWIEWKGVQYIIPALKMFLAEQPDAFFIFANTGGPFEKDIKQLLRSLPAVTYCTIPFENNLFALYQLFDFYVHVPIDDNIEAFGQTYIESMAAETPSIFTLSGIASEFVEHEKNALVVPYKDSEAIYHALKKLDSDSELRHKIVELGKRSVEIFSLNRMIEKLRELYLSSS